MAVLDRRTPRSRYLPGLVLVGLLGGALPMAATGQQAMATRITTANADAQRLASLMRGLAYSMQVASGALATDGQRLRATGALDDARRIARVLRDVAPGGEPAGRDGLDAVERARHALQNGNPAAASRILHDASVRMQRLATQAPADPVGAVRSADTGKPVINAAGQRLGRLERLLPKQDGVTRAVLKVGGVINLFGFVDAGYREVTVPVDQLVAGKTMVAITSSITPEQAGQLPAYGR